MRLVRVRLEEFRNYAELDFVPEPGLNVLVGRNAQGKSNLLEAIAMLGTGKSFRTARDGEAIRHGAKRGSVDGEAAIAAGEIRLLCTIERRERATRKQFAVNGDTVAFARFIGRTRVVTFVPADLALVSGGPTLRRAMMNGALAQLSPTYYRSLARYAKTVQQKNALLRGAIAPDRDLLLAYNDDLVASGTRLLVDRARFVAALAERAYDVHAQWVPADERVVVRYEPGVPLEGVDASDPAAVGTAFAAALAERTGAEIARRVTLVGPHRDDVRVTLGDDGPLGAFGSQGQQRSAVLALKVGEYGLVRDQSGEAPILLLDDVLSELDPVRAERFLGALGTVEQAFLTAVERPTLAAGAARTYTVDAARVTAC
jgi:DNA replication and repair protein RecF